MALALNNLQMLICHQTKKPNRTKQTYRIHSLKKMLEISNICRDKSWLRTIYSNWTFTDSNPGIKRNHNPMKIIAAIKTKGNAQINHLLPEDDLKRQKHVLKKKKKKKKKKYPKSKFTYGSVHLLFFSLIGSTKNFIYISKVDDCSWERPEGSLFISYYTEV